MLVRFTLDDRPMRATIAWGTRPEETDGDIVYLDRAAGFDLDEGEFPAGVVPHIGDATIGKGASGPGVALVLEIAEHALNDVASLIGLGIALRAAVRRISGRREGQPAGADAVALAAIAAAESERLFAHPESWWHVRTVPLTTDGSLGTDMRDVWASTFINDSVGVVEVVFTSSTTRYLGSVSVASEWAGDHIRSDAELATMLASRFEPGLPPV
jgi:hypothetical protein